MLWDTVRLADAERRASHYAAGPSSRACAQPSVPSQRCLWARLVRRPTAAARCWAATTAAPLTAASDGASAPVRAARQATPLVAGHTLPDHLSAAQEDPQQHLAISLQLQHGVACQCDPCLGQQQPQQQLLTDADCFHSQQQLHLPQEPHAAPDNGRHAESECPEVSEQLLGHLLIAEQAHAAWCVPGSESADAQPAFGAGPVLSTAAAALSTGPGRPSAGSQQQQGSSSSSCVSNSSNSSSSSNGARPRRTAQLRNAELERVGQQQCQQHPAGDAAGSWPASSNGTATPQQRSQQQKQQPTLHQHQQQQQQRLVEPGPAAHGAAVGQGSQGARQPAELARQHHRPQQAAATPRSRHHHHHQQQQQEKLLSAEEAELLQQQVELTQQIMAADSWQTLALLLDQHQGQLNHVHLIAMISRLDALQMVQQGKPGKKQQHKQRRQQQQQDHSHQQLRQQQQQEAQRLQPAAMSPRERAQYTKVVTWLFSTAGRVLPLLGPRELPVLLAGCVRLGLHPGKPWVIRVMTRCYHTMKQFTPEGLATTVWAIGQLGIQLKASPRSQGPGAAWARRVFTCFERWMRQGTASSRALTVLLHGLAKAGCWPQPEWLDGWQAALLGQRGSWSSQDVACALTALWDLRREAGSPLGRNRWAPSVELLQACQALLVDRGSRANHLELVNSIAALAQLTAGSQYDHHHLQQQQQQQQQQPVQQQSSQQEQQQQQAGEASTVVPHQHQQQQQQPPSRRQQLQAACEQPAPSQPHHHHQQQEQPGLADASQQQQQQQQPQTLQVQLVRRLLSRVQGQLSTMSGKRVVTVLYALARGKVPATAVPRLWRQHALAALQPQLWTLNEQGLANLLYALAQLQWRVGEPFKQVYTAVLARAAPGMSPMAWAMVDGAQRALGWPSNTDLQLEHARQQQAAQAQWRYNPQHQHPQQLQQHNWSQHPQQQQQQPSSLPHQRQPLSPQQQQQQLAGRVGQMQPQRRPLPQQQYVAQHPHGLQQQQQQMAPVRAQQGWEGAGVHPSSAPSVSPLAGAQGSSPAEQQAAVPPAAGDQGSAQPAELSSTTMQPQQHHPHQQQQLDPALQHLGSQQQEQQEQQEQAEQQVLPRLAVVQAATRVERTVVTFPRHLPLSKPLRK